MPQTAPDTPFLTAATLAATLEEWGPLEEAASPDNTPMHQTGYTLWKDGEQEAGIWECTPGPSYWRLETNEAVHVLAGRMTVTPDGGCPEGGGVPPSFTSARHPKRYLPWRSPSRGSTYVPRP